MAFNAGDSFTWRSKGLRRFKGSANDWRRDFPAIAADYTDIVIFGESGPYNQAVSALAKAIPARLWVMENGYFRPDWITLEQNGVNASSQLPRDAAGYGEPVPELPISRSVGKILPYHVINISVYHLVQLLGGCLYPNYRNPYTVPAWLQCVSHIQRYFRITMRNGKPCDAATLQARGAFFLACLQRDGDNQLIRYSKFADNTAFIAEVMGSFARYAPKSARLVFKNHPLDPGLVDFYAVVKSMAESKGLTGRVDFIDGGNLADMCRASSGMIVNNSSAALSALGFGTPVKVLGKAFFDFEGLTCQRPLNEFWKSPTPVDADLFKRFRAHVLNKAQINGNFHEPKSIRSTARAIAARFASVSA
ncbi:capsular biosynthesis protein [uncultured Brevundimonas sp.]|uniref:capsular biosynthesis protein n=1 Tax=uncultured Brevundimonas sp. TaxID=213418 RepID=UPI00260FADF6|nr:capsular biosynthesis protein [uncultured Brevundimonas sp.]